MKIGLPERSLLLGIEFDWGRVTYRRRLIVQRRNHPSPIETSSRTIRAMARAIIFAIIGVGSGVVVVDSSLSLATRKSS